MAGIITYPWAKPHGYNLKLKKKKAASYKPQAASALKQTQLKRIADAMEEILRLVKKDMENMKEAAK